MNRQLTNNIHDAIPVSLDQLRESYKIISSALEKACSSGAFTLTEAYVIKTSSMNIEKGIKQLENEIRIKKTDT